MQPTTGGKCDTCDKRLAVKEPVWEWRTPSTGTQEEAEQGLAFWAEDERWALCDECNEIVETWLRERQRDDIEDVLIVLAAKSLANQHMMVIGDPSLTEKLRQGQMEFVVNVLGKFLRNLVPHHTYQPEGM